MSLFPDVIGERLRFRPVFTVRKLQMGENHRQRLRKFLRPRFPFDLGYTLLQPSDAAAIDAHVLSQQGANVAFDWFFWAVFHWIWMPIGIGDGTTTLFTLPGKVTSNHEFFTGTGTSVSGVVSFGGGAQGEDQVNLSAAPASGISVWGNFSGRRRFTVKYERDDQPLTRIADTGYFTFQTRLIQVK